MIDNLPSNQREGGQQTSDSHDFIYEDKRALRLSHYVMAERCMFCLLYTSPSPRDMRRSRMPSSA